MDKIFRSRLSIGLGSLAALLPIGCGSSSSDAAQTAAGGFQLTSISVPNSASDWRINAPIVFTFNGPVDMSSVTGNTISIQERGGGPALGSFSFLPTETGVDRNSVVFEPTCPLEPAPFPDAGLQPGGVVYEITVRGGDDAGATVTSEGRRVETGQFREFSTPNSFAREDIFADTRPGPPQPLLFDGTGSPLSSTRLEILAEDGELESVPFPASALDCSTAESGAMLCETPLNLYTGQGGEVSFVLEFDQPVDPSPANISSSRIFLEFSNAGTDWTAIPAEVELLANCTATGAAVRVSPMGVLPPEADLRLVLSPDFSDLRGQSNDLLPMTDFAFARTRSAGTPGFVPEEGTADELYETFGLSGDDIGSLEDVTSAIAIPRASWGDEELRASFGFKGSGGLGGDFDYVIRAGEELVFDTSFLTINNAQQTRTQNVIGGVLDVRDFIVEQGAIVRVLGPNPLVVFATGEVRIDGTIDASGFPATDVGSLLVANVPHPGGFGLASAGTGGVGSPNTTSSSPAGQDGFGAFGTARRGGQGGETGYTASDADFDTPIPLLIDRQNRFHAGGGGGAVFGPAVGTPSDKYAGDGSAAQRGFDGWNSDIYGGGSEVDAPGAFGALSGELTPRGGDIGPGPFRTGATEDDFFGTRQMPDGTLVTGELPSLWYGSGGGAGGDTVALGEFPTPEFVPNNTTFDRKGGAGGGGGGAIHVLAIGDISFGPAARVIVEGGGGGEGENFPYKRRRPCGGGGGGSGGHVILETSSRLDLSRATGEVISTRGGLGAVSTICEGALFPYDACTDIEYIEFERLMSNGGAGGPGLVQVHVPGSTYALQLDAIDFPDAGSEVLGDYMLPPPVVALPSFSARSMGLSQWVPLGGASSATGGSSEDLEFLFSDVLDTTVDPDDETAAGRIKTESNGVVMSEEPLLEGTLPAAAVNGEALRVTVDAGVLVGTPDDVYLRNTALLRDFDLRLTGGFEDQKFTVTNAVFDIAAGDLTLFVVDGAGDLLKFETGGSFQLIPRFFRVNSIVGGVKVRDLIPTGARVSIQFQATGVGEDGLPDEESPIVDWTGDLEDLNDPSLTGENAPAFIRLRVTFDINDGGAGAGLASPRPAIEFLRLPFRF